MGVSMNLFRKGSVFLMDPVCRIRAAVCLGKKKSKDKTFRLKNALI